MSKERFEQWGYESFKDNKTGEIYDNYIDLLNEQSQRIAELEGQFAYECECNKQFVECQKENEKLKQQLKNSIRPKFKVNDKIFVIVNNEVEEYYVDEVLLKFKGTLVAYRDICKQTTISEKNELFATKEEAQERLKKL